MRKTLLQIATSLLLLFTVQVALAQTPTSTEIKDLQDKLQKVETANSKLNSDLKILKTEFLNKLDAAKDSINVLRSELELNKNNISTVSNDLGVKIDSTKTSADNQIKGVQKAISKNTLYWIIAVL